MLANLLLQSFILYAIVSHAAVIHEFKGSNRPTNLPHNSNSTLAPSTRPPSTPKYPITLPSSLSPLAGATFTPPENSGDLRPQTQLPDSRHPFSTPVKPRADETPLKLFPIECNNPSHKEYNRHRDIHHDGVNNGIERF
ncbi:hypothetical protein CSAL01_00359 [Colletotrichum salicis]|uniref:Uncharacterized protein n=1 Tax=Colletotrichum salicis TaxID=1209931 RepID=A0A135SFU9_9PEZI|nr:hypothetical protein CSAL01_00359 [Colletotrichum salicis]